MLRESGNTITNNKFLQ